MNIRPIPRMNIPKLISDLAVSSSFLKAFIINTKKIERINPAIKATATIGFFLGLIG